MSILLTLAILLTYSWATPRLLWVAPRPDAAPAPPSAQIHLAFSRPLNTTALIERLLIEPTLPGEYTWQGNLLIFTPRQPWAAGTEVRVRLLPGVPARTFPALPLRQGLEWSFQIRQPGIAYLFPANLTANVYLLNLASGEGAQLTNIPDGVLDFTVNADGTALYYSAHRPAGGSAIWRLDLSSLDADTLAPETTPTLNPFLAAELVFECPDANCQELALEPAGRYLAYERISLPGSDGASFPQVWVLPLLGNEAENPFLAGQPDHQTTLPSWSSSGLLALYDQQAAAYLFIEPNGREMGHLPNQTGQRGVWRPDGRAFLAAEITFLDLNISPELADLQPLADSRLQLYLLDEGRIENLTPGEGLEDASPAYSPAGEYLAFTRKYLDIPRWTPGRQIWIAQTENRAARQVTDAPIYTHYDLAWSPSGEELAFVRFNQSTLSEPPEIWLLNLRTGEATLLIEGGYQPRWIP